MATSGSNLHSTPARIDRQALVRRYNPVRHQSSTLTPLQVGNGRFAFGCDVTGLQTFNPFATMSDWGWKTDPKPHGTYVGVKWDVHGRPVSLDTPDPAQPEITQWSTANPNRLNLARLALHMDAKGEDELANCRQELDLYSGVINSSFTYKQDDMRVHAACHPRQDTLGLEISSTGRKLGLSLEFPYSDGSAKFVAPFVGVYDQPSKHVSDTVKSSPKVVTVSHSIGGTVYYVTIASEAAIQCERPDTNAHRYIFTGTATLRLSINFALTAPADLPDPCTILQASADHWRSYWETGGFVDVVSHSTDVRADELQRRIVLSMYLMAVNASGRNPPPESGLVNNGWFGKFHMEMIVWHATHWALWDRFDRVQDMLLAYDDFLDSSIVRAQTQQGYAKGARWPKMTDASGTSAPGEINNLLIWQQPHPIWFAELQYRIDPAPAVLLRWEPLVNATADFMSAFAHLNPATGKYDLGPPMYDVAERTGPYDTINPSFELAYWHWGLSTAIVWCQRLGKSPPENWERVRNGLVDLPRTGETYSISQTAGNFWANPHYTFDHPTMVGLYGWLPRTDVVDVHIARTTAAKVRATWDLTHSYGWDFPMLAMSAAKLQDRQQAIDDLFSPYWSFDDAGYPSGSEGIVPTPYFPGAGALLWAVAMMAAGWDGSEAHGPAPGFPTLEQGWAWCGRESVKPCNAMARW